MEKYFPDDIVRSTAENFELLLSVKLPIIVRPEKVYNELLSSYFYKEILRGKGVPEVSLPDRSASV
jgi:hypothetical protein